MRKRILMASNYYPSDTTCWLRGQGVFKRPEMREHCEIVEPPIKFVDNKFAINLETGWWVDFRNWLDIDVCYMYRPYGRIGATIMAHAQMYDIPLWVDHDDDLLSVPKDNPYHHEYKDSETAFPTIEMSYRDAAVLTCSGLNMQKEISQKYKRKVIRIPNGLDDRLLKFKKPFQKSNKVGWRGSKSHMSDLQHFEFQFRTLFKKYPDTMWHFFGLDPREAFGSIDINAEFSPPRNLFPYMADFTNANCMLHVVPLEDNKFNRTKSNLAWLEATLAGSVVLGPDWPEWESPGVLHYTDNFAQRFIDIVDSSSVEFLKSRHDMAWNFIQAELITSKLNETRIEILRRL